MGGVVFFVYISIWGNSVMTVLGVLLIIAGLFFAIEASFLWGAIIITGGVICIAAAGNKKEKEEKQAIVEKKTKTKEEWILTRTQFYMEKGDSPTDAKVKAEVDYAKHEKESLNKPKRVYDKTAYGAYQAAVDYLKKDASIPSDAKYNSWTEDATELNGKDSYRITVRYNGECSKTVYASYINQKDEWRITE